MFLMLLAITALLAVAIFRFRRRRLYELASLLPGPPNELPLIGVAKNLTGSSEDCMEQMKFLSYATMKNNGLMRVWLGPCLIIAMVDPVDIEYVMKNCLDKSDDFHRFPRAVIGNGAIFAPLSIWRRRRKITIPVFSPKIVDSFVEVFSRQSEKLANILARHVGKGEVTLWPILSTYTLDSVCETTMGVKINAQDNPETPFLVAMNNILHLVCERFFRLWLQPDWLYKLFPQYQRHQLNRMILHEFTDDVIKRKKEDIKADTQSKPESENEYDLGNYQTKTFLHHLINSSGGDKGYTNVELREEMLTLAIAGTDTSAVASGFTLKLLSKYPHIQEKVYQELYEIFGDSDRPLVKDDLMKMKYMERVIKESMRLFPPVPLIMRQTVGEIKLPSGWVLPDKSPVTISIWGVHRDPKYWGPTAEEFDPDRFLPERFNLAHPCSFMPFSHGPRNCVGYQYALMSIKAGLSAVLRQYKVVCEPEKTAVPHIRVKMDLMMKDVDEYKVFLERRKPETSQ